MRRFIFLAAVGILLVSGGIAIGWNLDGTGADTDSGLTRQLAYELFGEDGLEHYENKERYDISGEGLLREGDLAPDFELPSVDGRVQRISDFHEDRPLALIFGSYT